MARPRKELENLVFNGWDQLEALIVWADKEHCCSKLGIDEKTLSKRIVEKTGLSFSEYKHQKKGAMRTNLRKKQYDVAMAGNVSMLIWLGKNELGQSDKQELEQTTKVEITIDDDESKL